MQPMIGRSAAPDPDSPEAPDYRRATTGRGRTHVDEVLGQMLRRSVTDKLDSLDRLAEHAHLPEVAPTTRVELLRLIRSWQEMVTAHYPDERGNCPQCSTKLRPHRAPCAISRIAGRMLAEQRDAGRSEGKPLPPRTPARAPVDQAIPAARRPLNPALPVVVGVHRSPQARLSATRLG